MLGRTTKSIIVVIPIASAYIIYAIIMPRQCQWASMSSPWDSPINITSNATGMARAMAMTMLHYKYIIPFRPRFLNFSPLAPGADPEGGGGARPLSKM